MIKKKFNKNVNEVLMLAYLFYNEYLADQTQFEAFSTLFTPAFAVDFLDLIKTAEDLKTYHRDLNNQSLLTSELATELDKAKRHYQKLLLHVKFAFPGDETALMIFGKNSYLESRKSPSKMVFLLKCVCLEANSEAYNSILIDVGFVQSEITLLDTLADNLSEKLGEQQLFLRHSETRANNRILAFNRVWDVMVQISGAAKLIFTDSPAKIQYYQLYS